jgi:LysR family transcriptional regulator, transcriptional activator of nhaA
MDTLNFHHLRYFWMVAHEGSIVAASRKLHVSHPTISAQLRQLEAQVGTQLLVRKGRGLALTDAGVAALRTADAIFSLGNELLATARDGAHEPTRPLRVGVIDVVPKTIVMQLLAPALRLGPRFHLVVREGRSLEEFLAEMLTQELDVVLSDRQADGGLPLELYSHLLSTSRSVILAQPAMADALRADFPRSLHDAPFVAPSHQSSLRRSTDAWFVEHGIRPRVVAEVDDTALVKVFAESGLGFCVLPAAVQTESERRYDLQLVGEAPIEHRTYAISVARQRDHAGVIAIRRGAQAVGGGPG